MKLIHMSDLHLGKRLNGYSLLDDQTYILQRILKVIDDEAPGGVIIAGDVYDKAAPSAEAVSLFDDFLFALVRRKLEVFIISGNHDSPERIAFASRILHADGVHLSPVYNGKIEPVRLRDEYGALNVYLLPFIKPAHVRRYYEDEEIASYTDAVRCAVEHMRVDPAARNLLVTHQFVTGAQRSESEEISVGGSDNVDAAVFAAFDYVALGHIHSPQNCGSPTVRYCGTPLKYSFSEAGDKKSVTVIDFRAKGDVTYRTVELVPKRDLVELKGAYGELMNRAYYENTSWTEDYTHVTLTDEEDVPDAIGRLRTVYRNLMKLDYDNKRTRTETEISGAADPENKSPLALFSELYELQNNAPMTEEQRAYVRGVIEKTWEEQQ